MTSSGREWVDAFHFAIISGDYTRHTVSGLRAYPNNKIWAKLGE